MENLEQFIAKQNAELEKKKAELAEFEAFDVPEGLDPWLIHGKLYGVRHFAFKCKDLFAFIKWARINHQKVQAIEGRYCTFHPFIPETRDYEGSKVTAQGDLILSYCTIIRKFEMEVFAKGCKVSFDLPDEFFNSVFCPRGIYKSYATRYNGKKEIERWERPNCTNKKYLRLGIDKQSASVEILFTFDEFESAFLKGSK